MPDYKEADQLRLRRSGSVSGDGNGSPGPNALLKSESVVSFDSWVVPKLKKEWSSSELGSLLSRDKLSKAVGCFCGLETPIKVRFLLSFLSMRREDFEESKLALVEIVDAAENDSEEWVKIGAGIVKQYMFMSENGGENDTFFHEQLAQISAKVLAAVDAPQPNRDDSDDFFCHENAFLNPSIRPEGFSQPTQHFTVCEDATNKEDDHDGRTTQRKQPLHRPQMARPSLHASTLSSAPSRLTPASAAKAQPPPRPKKLTTELSEIRRKADAGRFKRQRSRISMIDIDEVKQIVSEKAQKAEERKKLKIKESKDKTGTGIGDKSTGAAEGSSQATSSQGDADAHNTPEHTVSDGHATDQNRAGERNSEDAHDDYAHDGTNALLHAALHSTHDIMNEVTHTQHQQQSTQYQGAFEPEDANAQPMSYGYGFNTAYTSHFGDGNGSLQQQGEATQYGYDSEQYGNAPQRQMGFDNTQGSNSHNSHGGFLDGPPDYWR